MTQPNPDSSAAAAIYAPGSRLNSERPWLAPVSVALLAILASLPSLWNGFAYDDFFIIANNARVHSLAEWWNMFAEPYWPAERGSEMYRPLTIFAFAVQWVAGGGSPFAFHLVNVLLYAACAVAVLYLCGAALPAGVAWAMAAIFAVHPVHVEAVANVVGQPEITVALAAALAAGIYIRARARGGPDVRSGAAILALYMAASLCKEHALVLPALLLAAEFTVVTPPPGARVPRNLRIFYLALVLVALVYMGVRSAVLGDMTGGDPHMALRGLSTGQRIVAMLGLVPELLRLLFWPSRLSVDYSPMHVIVAEGITGGVALGTLLLAAIATLAWLARSGYVAATFGALWMAIAFAPLSNVLFPTGVLLAERTLFLPSVGAVIFLGAGAVWLRARALEGGRQHVAALAAVAAVLVIAGGWRSAARAPVWRDSNAVFASMLVDAPLGYRGHWLRGMALFQAGYKADGERSLQHAIRLFPEDDKLLSETADWYRKSDVCEPAIRLYREALRLDPSSPEPRSGLIACLLRQRRYDEVRDEAAAGIAAGRFTSMFRRVYRSADSAEAANARAARR